MNAESFWYAERHPQASGSLTTSMNALGEYVNSRGRFSVDKDHDVYDYTRKTWDHSPYAVERAFVKLMNDQGIKKDDMRTALNNNNNVHVDNNDDVVYYGPEDVYFDLNQQWDIKKYAIERAYFITIISTQTSNLASSSTQKSDDDGPDDHYRNMRSDRQIFLGTEEEVTLWKNIGSTCLGEALEWLKAILIHQQEPGSLTGSAKNVYDIRTTSHHHYVPYADILADLLAPIPNRPLRHSIPNLLGHCHCFGRRHRHWAQ